MNFYYANFWKPLVHLKIHRLPFGCCELPLVTQGSCIPCGAAHPLGTRLHWNSLTTWCKNVSAPSLVCMLRLLRGNKQAVAWAKPAWGSAPLRSMRQVPTLPQLALVPDSVVSLMAATG